MQVIVVFIKIIIIIMRQLNFYAYDERIKSNKSTYKYLIIELFNNNDIPVINKIKFSIGATSTPKRECCRLLRPLHGDFTR